MIRMHTLAKSEFSLNNTHAAIVRGAPAAANLNQAFPSPSPSTETGSADIANRTPHANGVMSQE